MKKENCIFCKITNGEIPSASIYEDEIVKVILDISPASRGHAIIIPKTHVENIFDLDEGQASKIFIVATKIAKVMKEVLNIEGLNILQNNGEIAGQTVFHFHMHLIPRYRNDKIIMKWCQGKYEGEDIEDVAMAIREKLS